MANDVPDKFSPNLFLTGVMGTGKTSLARLLASRWRRPFVDTDQIIEQRIRMPIRDFFAKEGEPAFRALERKCIEEWIPTIGAIVSCGGGLVLPEGMIDLLKSRGVVICLFASPETIYRRTKSSKHRPLLLTENPEERIRLLLEEREPVYRRAGTGILTDGRNFSDLAVSVERIYRREIETLRRRIAEA